MKKCFLQPQSPSKQESPMGMRTSCSFNADLKITRQSDGQVIDDQSFAGAWAPEHIEQHAVPVQPETSFRNITETDQDPISFSFGGFYGIISQNVTGTYLNTNNEAGGYPALLIKFGRCERI